MQAGGARPRARRPRPAHHLADRLGQDAGDRLRAARRSWRSPRRRAARARRAPRALVVAPTRELAHQVEDELQLAVRATARRTSSRHRRRELPRRAPRARARARASSSARRAACSITCSAARSIRARSRRSCSTRPTACSTSASARTSRRSSRSCRPSTRTHLVSATFPREVRALADRVQRDPAHVEGTRLGAANADIEHVVHVVEPRQQRRRDREPAARRPRGADAGLRAHARRRRPSSRSELRRAGFAATALSGEMDQPARNRALAAFKRGARARAGRDRRRRARHRRAGHRARDPRRAADQRRRVHAPRRPHRPRRPQGHELAAGRAVAASCRRRACCARAGVPHRFEPIPSAGRSARAQDERVFAELTREARRRDAEPIDRALALAQRLLAAGDGERVLARLLVRARTAAERRAARGPRGRPARPRAPRRPPPRRRATATTAATTDATRREPPPPRHAPPRARSAGATAPRSRAASFRSAFTWGGRHGADARRCSRSSAAAARSAAATWAQSGSRPSTRSSRLRRRWRARSRRALRARTRATSACGSCRIPHRADPVDTRRPSRWTRAAQVRRPRAAQVRRTRAAQAPQVSK